MGLPLFFIHSLFVFFCFVTAETAFSSFTLETSQIVNKPFKPWRVVLDFNEKLIRGTDKIIIGSRVAPKSTYFCAPYMLE